MNLHKFCAAFPAMSPEEFQETVTGMQLNGYRKEEPIITFKGEILDGRNRFEAAKTANVKPVFKVFKGTDSQALSLVISKNLFRRNLTTGQRSMIAADIGKFQNSDSTITETADKMGVSRDSAHKAVKLKKESPALAKQVRAGKMSLNQASKKAGIVPTPSIKAMLEKNSQTLGEICREAYFKKLGSEGTQSWNSLAKNEKAAWESAADSVKGKV